MKKVVKAGILAGILLGILTFTVAAADTSTESNGYWTMVTDESGIPVMIYTYTSTVDWVVDEQADLGRCSMDASQVNTVEGTTDLSADTIADAEPLAAAKTADIASSSDNPFDFINTVVILFCAGGLFSLIFTSYLYKIRYKLVKKMKAGLM